MLEQIELLLIDAGGDGASDADGVRGDGGAEAALLLEAWERERGLSIERSLVLTLARNLLARIAEECPLSARRRRDARRLFRAIERVQEEVAPVADPSEEVRDDGPAHWIG